mmetsp:Transcript_109816/g.342290  ORF Transcript_109816/g.342290 Transcript_109816/m.342290 type:complete len:163 (-) Transcript_109816:311-799(-)
MLLLPHVAASACGCMVVLGEMTIDSVFDIQALRGDRRAAYDYYRLMLAAAHVNVVTLISIIVVVIVPLLGATTSRSLLILGAGNASAASSYLVLIMPRYVLITGGAPNFWNATSAPFEPSVFDDWWKVCACRAYISAWIFANLFALLWQAQTSHLAQQACLD